MFSRLFPVSLLESVVNPEGSEGVFFSAFPTAVRPINSLVAICGLRAPVGGRNRVSVVIPSMMGAVWMNADSFRDTVSSNPSSRRWFRLILKKRPFRCRFVALPLAAAIIFTAARWRAQNANLRCANEKPSSIRFATYKLYQVGENEAC